MKNLVYTVVTNTDYFEQFDLFYKSFISHNDASADMLVVTTTKEAVGLRQKYPGVKVVEENSPNKLVLYRFCEYRYNIFDYLHKYFAEENYDKLFYSDPDVLIVKKISLIFDQICTDSFYALWHLQYSEKDLDYDPSKDTHISYRLCEVASDKAKQFVRKNNILLLASGNFACSTGSEFSKNLMKGIQTKFKDITRQTTDNAILNTVLIEMLAEVDDANKIKWLKFVTVPPFDWANGGVFHFVHPSREKGLVPNKLTSMKTVYDKLIG